MKIGNYRYIDSITNKLNKFCIDCGKKVSRLGTKRCQTCYGIIFGKKQLEDKNPNWNQGISIIKHYCIVCGKELKNYYAKRCYKCWVITNTGKNNYNWQGGIGNEPYPLEFNDKLKDQIRKRDNYTCQNCSMTEEEHLIIHGINLHIHHIDYNKKNCDESNLITLCMPCNTRANKNKTYWKCYYKEKLLCVSEQ